jgi:UDP-N-acetylmuramoyl-tripeptide--D-alanyl-D-alanine ligase
MKIEHIYKIYSEHYLVDTDTRKIRKNTIFFALKGENFNGNKFAEKALSIGANYAIVDEEKYQTNSKIILVDDVLKTLQHLANYHRKQLNIPIIALTGSNGKTTTKELINIILKKHYKTTATVGNLNNHIGVPLTLLSMDKNTEIGIIEMGANHHDEIRFLSKITDPDFGYITNFGKAHIEGFGSLEGVITAKSELYEYLENNNKIAFINPEDVIQVEKTIRIQRILFNKNIELLDVNPFVKLKLDDIEIQTNLIGKYNYNNIAAAITIGKYFKIETTEIKEALKNYIPNNNRSEIIKTKNNQILLDAYNANPSSVKAALDSFHHLKYDSKTIILGDMFELGKDSIEEHQNISDWASSLNFNTILLVGENFKKIKTDQLQFETFEKLKNHIIKHPIDNNFILIKGSRGMALERILDVLN